MSKDPYWSFCSQLDDAITKFPGLAIKEKGGRKCLKGVLDIPNDDFKIVGNYLIEICFAPGFPFRFPILFETGGSIPNEADWHKYSDGRCCITVLPDEILKCKHGITVIEFIEKYALSFFANHIHKKITNKYLNGEYSHKNGVFEFYAELFQTKDPGYWIEYFKHVFEKNSLPAERNNLCFCGSNKKYKNCHQIIFGKMWDIGQLQIRSDFKNILL